MVHHMHASEQQENTTFKIANVNLYLKIVCIPANQLEFQLQFFVPNRYELMSCRMKRNGYVYTEFTSPFLKP